MAEGAPERLRRLLTLVPWLAAHSGISKAEAARHFGLTVAQLEADLALLTVTGPGLYGGDLVDIAFEHETVTVIDAQGLVAPLRLTTDEAAPLLLGLRALQQLPDVDAAVVARLIDMLGGAPDDAVVVEVPHSPHAATIASALREGLDLRLGYRHPVRDEVSERTVRPLAVVTRDGIEYLQAHCHTAQAVRTFRLDRIRTCSAVPTTADVPEPSTLSDASVHRLARVRVTAGAEHLLEGVARDLARDDTGSVIAAVPYADEAWLESWLVAAGAHVRCLEPTDLAERVRARANGALAAYGTGRATL